MALTIQLQPKQKEALLRLSNDSLVKVLGYGGAKGGGKSYLARAWMIMRRDKYPQTHGAIIRKTYPELYDTHIKKIFEEYPELRSYYNESKKTIFFPNGSTIAFRYLEHTADVYKFQGAEYEDICLDEAGQHSREVIEILRTSLRTTKKYINPKMLLTFNPGGVGHPYLKRIFIDRQFDEHERSEDFAFVRATVYDNAALLDNDPAYLDTLKGLPAQTRRAYLDGDFDSFKGQFFTEWNKTKHVISPRYELSKAPDSYKYFGGMDDGKIAPRSFHIYSQDNDGRIEAIFEYYKAGEDISEASYNIKEELTKAGIYELVKRKAIIYFDAAMLTGISKDPHDSSSTAWITSIDIFRNITGLTCESSPKARIEGWKRVHEFLRWSVVDEPLLRVWDTCPNLIRTIPEQIFDDHQQEDLNSDGEDHAVDDLRYALMGLQTLPTRLAKPYVAKKPVKHIQRIILNPLSGV